MIMGAARPFSHTVEIGLAMRDYLFSGSIPVSLSNVSTLNSPHRVTLRMMDDAVPLSELYELARTRLRHITAV